MNSGLLKFSAQAAAFSISAAEKRSAADSNPAAHCCEYNTERNLFFKILT
jgi:hypothetical protein